MEYGSEEQDRAVIAEAERLGLALPDASPIDGWSFLTHLDDAARELTTTAFRAATALATFRGEKYAEFRTDAKARVMLSPHDVLGFSQRFWDALEARTAIPRPYWACLLNDLAHPLCPRTHPVACSLVADSDGGSEVMHVFRPGAPTSMVGSRWHRDLATIEFVSVEPRSALRSVDIGDSSRGGEYLHFGKTALMAALAEQLYATQDVQAFNAGMRALTAVRLND